MRRRKQIFVGVIEARLNIAKGKRLDSELLISYKYPMPPVSLLDSLEVFCNIIFYNEIAMQAVQLMDGIGYYIKKFER